MPHAARRVVGAEREHHALVEQRADRRLGRLLQRGARRDHGGHAAAGQRRHVLVGRGVQQVGGRAAEFGGDPGRAARAVRVPAGVQPRQQPGAAARVEYPAGLFLAEPAVLAVDVDAVRAHGGRVRAPGRHRVDVVAAAAEELRRHHLRRVERDVHPRHARLVLERAEHPHVGELTVPGEVVAGLRLDRRGARLQPAGEPLADVVAQGPRVGAPGHGDGGRDAAARRGDLRVRQAGGPHGQLRVAVARVDRVRVRVDQAGGDEAAAQVLHQVDVDDVVDDAGDAARQFGRRADPGDAVIADEDGGIADDLGPGPQPADAREQPGGHRVFPSCTEARGSVLVIMSGHLPCMLDVGADRTYRRYGRHAGWLAPAARPVLHIDSVTVLHRGGSLQAPYAKPQATGSYLRVQCGPLTSK